MKNLLVPAIAVVLIVFGYAAGCQRGNAQHRKELADAVRAAGDSAVTAYLSSGELEEFVGEALRDTVEHYEAKVEAATKIEIRRVPIVVRDTVVVVQAPEDSISTTVQLPPYDSAGVRVEEVLTFTPQIRPGTVLSRDLKVSFDPDTLTVALLGTPGGLQRFTAYLEGQNLRVVDAGALDHSPSLGSRLVTAAGVAGCLASGVQVGRGVSGTDLGTAGVGVLVGGGLLCARELVKLFR